MTQPATDAIGEIQRRHGIVGREDELALALAVLTAGRHLLLEGPVGVGKTTVALAVCDHLGRRTIRVDGDDRYSEAKLTGWFDPPLVLSAGFGEESFTAGPLVEAMRTGAVLFINELNRMPETVQNVLLPALDERRIGVPHLGEVVAAPGFQVVATQNPVEYVATGHLSEALRDRFEHLGLAYQSAAEEAAIVATEAALAEAGDPDPRLVEAAVRLARASREHARIRKGASVRGAIATVEIAMGLGGDPIERATFRRAAAAALRTRIELRDEAGATFDAVLDELVESALRPVDGETRAPPRGGDLRDPGGRDEPGGTVGAGSDPPAADDVERDPRRRAAMEARLDEILAATVRSRAPRSGTPTTVVDGRLDPWELAAALTSGGLRYAGADARARAEQLAVAEVMRRAAALAGPLRGRTRIRRAPLADGRGGDLDVGTTLENAAGKPHPETGDWVVERREEERRRIVLLIDTSGSMGGEPMALAAVAAAVVALKVPPGDLGLVAFDDDAHALVELGEAVPPAEAVRRLLARSCGGRTNLHAALALGERQLAARRDPRRTAVVISDGLYTLGPDPRPLASGFRALHFLRTAASRMPPGVWINPVRQAGDDLAELGGGRLVAVETFAELPRRTLELAEAILR